MKKSLLAAALASAFAAPSLVHAQAAAPASPHTFTANVSLVSDYRFRGISQTFNLPAIQGGFDYSHSSGLYAGIWSSNVYGGTNASGLGVNFFNGGQEVDIYGGYKWTMGDFGLDAGVLTYIYPGAKYGVPTTDKYSNTELYIGASWKFLTLKYSNAITDYFGVKTNTMSGACGVNSNGVATATCMPVGAGGSKGSGYLDLSGAYDIGGGFNLVGHIGRLSVRHYNLFNYTDWKVGVTKDWAGATWGLAYVDTDAKSDVYNTAKIEGTGLKVKDTSKGTVVLSVSKTF